MPNTSSNSQMNNKSKNLIDIIEAHLSVFVCIGCCCLLRFWRKIQTAVYEREVILSRLTMSRNEPRATLNLVGLFSFQNIVQKRLKNTNKTPSERRHFVCLCSRKFASTKHAQYSLNQFTKSINKLSQKVPTRYELCL